MVVGPYPISKLDNGLDYTRFASLVTTRPSIHWSLSPRPSTARASRLGYAQDDKMIVNLEPNHLPGSHWVAIYRRAAKGYYFDSFGRLPPTTIRIWLANNTQRWAYQPRMIQSPNDKVSCGYICYEFLKRL